MGYRTLAALMLLLPSLLLADEPKNPTTPEARGAMARHAKAVADAEAATKAARREADQQLVKELTQIRANVMKAGTPAALAEAGRIQKVIDEAGRANTASPTSTATKPTGRWRIGLVGVDARRDYQIAADGMVSNLDGGRATVAGPLTREGNSWVFKDPKFDRIRKLVPSEEGVLLVISYNLKDPDGEPENVGVATPIK